MDLLFFQQQISHLSVSVEAPLANREHKNKETFQALPRRTETILILDISGSFWCHREFPSGTRARNAQIKHEYLLSFCVVPLPCSLATKTRRFRLRFVFGFSQVSNCHSQLSVSTWAVNSENSTNSASRPKYKPKSLVKNLYLSVVIIRSCLT